VVVRIQLVMLTAVLLVGCGRALVAWDGTAVGEGAGGGAASGAGGGAGGSGGGSVVVAADLPCDVAQLLSTDCAACHGAPTPGLIRLADRADLLASSPSYPGSTEGQRAVARMELAVGEMPPSPAAPVDAGAVAAFAAWVSSGMPAGSCSVATGDGGAVVSWDAGTWDGGLAGLPCDVAAMVASNCLACHGPRGPNMPLLSLANFLAPAPSNPAITVAASVENRLHSTTQPMPPLGNPAPSATAVAAYDAWYAGGTQPGTCGSIDAGLLDGGLWPTSCASGNNWDAGTRESANMEPGQACLACHTSRGEADKLYTFSGTVFAGLHEWNNCLDPAPAGGYVEIIGADGKALTPVLYTSAASGNFHSQVNVPVLLPYTARVWRNGVYTQMTTPQTDGDCNGCHTEQGASGAPGRIVWP
jgi:mono/diheme cytochrome c family protein